MEQVVGVGQAGEQRSIRIVAPQGQRWLLAFVNGAKPNVLLGGTIMAASILVGLALH